VWLSLYCYPSAEFSTISAVIFIFYWPLAESLAGTHGVVEFSRTPVENHSSTNPQRNSSEYSKVVRAGVSQNWFPSPHRSWQQYYLDYSTKQTRDGHFTGCSTAHRTTCRLKNLRTGQFAGNVHPQTGKWDKTFALNVIFINLLLANSQSASSPHCKLYQSATRAFSNWFVCELSNTQHATPIPPGRLCSLREPSPSSWWPFHSWPRHGDVGREGFSLRPSRACSSEACRTVWDLRPMLRGLPASTTVTATNLRFHSGTTKNDFSFWSLTKLSAQWGYASIVPSKCKS